MTLRAAAAAFAGSPIACDQEHERDGAGDGEHNGTRVADQIVGERAHPERPARRVGVVLLVQLPRERRDRIARLRHRHTRPKPCDHVEVLGAPSARPALLGREGDRRPRVGRPRKRRRGRHHADDLVRDVVEADRPTDDARIGAEAAAPQPITQHDHAIPIGCVLLGGEPATDRDAQAENGLEAL
jgi:hypothetical protein